MLNQRLKSSMLGIALVALTACGGAPRTATEPVPVTSTTTSATGYGVVQAIDIVPREQAGIGVGTIAGAAVGGVLGSQVGSGRGRTAATVAGAAGGALAGRALERAREGEVYRVAIRMDNGAVQTMTQETPPGLQIGERVRLSNGVIVERFR